MRLVFLHSPISGLSDSNVLAAMLTALNTIRKDINYNDYSFNMSTHWLAGYCHIKYTITVQSTFEYMGGGAGEKT